MECLGAETVDREASKLDSEAQTCFLTADGEQRPGQENKEYLVPHSFEFSADQLRELQETGEALDNCKQIIQPIKRQFQLVS